MLKSLKLENFQKHESCVIELSPTVTCIVGDTDSGKSSTLRALRWVCMNRPSGDSFKRHGSDCASASIEVGDSSLERRRTKSKNAYILDDKEFVALGQNIVPEEVQNLLNVGDVNFALQHDPPFWLTLSPGELSRELNAIVDLSRMDRSLAYLAGEVRKSKAEVSVCESRLESEKRKLEDLSWVEEADEELRRLEDLEANMASRRDRIDSLASILDRAEHLTQERDGIRYRLVGFREAIQLAEAYRDRAAKLEALERLCSDGIRLLEERSGTRNRLGAARQRLETVKSCPLCGQRIGK